MGNFSLIEVAELQFGYVMELDRAGCGRASAVRSARPTEATEAFEASRVEAAEKTVWVTGCMSWYLDDRGVPATWPWPFDRFRAEMRAPDLAAFEQR